MNRRFVFDALDVVGRTAVDPEPGAPDGLPPWMDPEPGALPPRVDPEPVLAGALPPRVDPEPVLAGALPPRVDPEPGATTTTAAAEGGL